MGTLAPFRAVGLAAALGIGSAARPIAPAIASDCPGMTSYSYDGVTCSDTAGSTSQTMRDMYRAGDRLQQGMIDRSRGLYGGSGGGGYRYVPLARYVPAVAQASFAERERHLYFRRGSSAPALRAIDASIHVKPAFHARALAGEREMLHSWYADAPARGFTPRSVESAHIFFLESAFHARDGGWPSDRTTPQLLTQTLTQSVIRSGAPILNVSDAVKQRVAEVFAVRGMLMLEMRAAAKTAAQKSRLSAIASMALRSDLGGDVSQYTIDTLPCAVAPLGAATSCGEWLATMHAVMR